MSDTLFDTDSSWVAWRRKAGTRRWVAVASGATEGLASAALHQYLRRDGIGSGDSMVCRPGETPNEDLPGPSRGGPAGRRKGQEAVPTPRTPRVAVFHRG